MKVLSWILIVMAGVLVTDKFLCLIIDSIHEIKQIARYCRINRHRREEQNRAKVERKEE